MDNKLRFLTAASLFDGHDVSINIMRRILQASGAEVIHLGHNRSVTEVLRAALQEDVHAIAISSYQGGHVEYFKYLVDLLKQHDASHIKTFGGGGGVFTPAEIEELHAYGVTRIYTPADGQQLGLQGIIDDMLNTSDLELSTIKQKQITLPRLITKIQEQKICEDTQKKLTTEETKTPILGITGTGGAGKSSLTDELIQRFRQDKHEVRIAIIALDPTKRATGGALLGDRIRMNSIDSDTIFMRSLATRSDAHEVTEDLNLIIAACGQEDFDLIIIETPGIGQGDAGIVPFVDLSLYVMTPEFGAASQLEKIDMLDFANVVAINKFDRRGALDALRDVSKQMQRSKKVFDKSLDEMPAFGTMASRLNDTGVNALYQHLLNLLNDLGKNTWQTKLPTTDKRCSEFSEGIVPNRRQRYLAEIADTVRDYHQTTEQQIKIAQQLEALEICADLINDESGPRGRCHGMTDLDSSDSNSILEIRDKLAKQLNPDNKKLLDNWETEKARYQQAEYQYQVREKQFTIKQQHLSLSGLAIPKVAFPNFVSAPDRLRWLRKENVPGQFPYTAGVFPFRREGEDPGRMFAGEGDAFRTNKRFKFLSKDLDANRLSTAFDSVTLYGFDPAKRPDIYGKIGNAGVSIASLADMQVLYDGFDLCAKDTSVSMTINGPAPTILAMFLNTAILQQQAKYPNEDPEVIKAKTLQQVRGTVQADILKEDQAQNTCIFSIDFSLKMMADIQQYFVENQVRNFYSVSISGYHIAEAGANPISQLAFTLSNGFTYVEAYLARGMHIDDFAANLSFSF